MDLRGLGLEYFYIAAYAQQPSYSPLLCCGYFVEFPVGWPQSAPPAYGLYASKHPGSSNPTHREVRSVVLQAQPQHSNDIIPHNHRQSDRKRAPNHSKHLNNHHQHLRRRPNLPTLSRPSPAPSANRPLSSKQLRLTSPTAPPVLSSPNVANKSTTPSRPPSRIPNNRRHKPAPAKTSARGQDGGTHPNRRAGWALK